MKCVCRRVQMWREKVQQWKQGMCFKNQQMRSQNNRKQRKRYGCSSHQKTDSYTLPLYIVLSRALQCSRPWSTWKVQSPTQVAAPLPPRALNGANQIVWPVHVSTWTCGSNRSRWRVGEWGWWRTALRFLCLGTSGGRARSLFTCLCHQPCKT